MPSRPSPTVHDIHLLVTVIRVSGQIQVQGKKSGAEMSS
jgi:hypothetical protein